MRILVVSAHFPPNFVSGGTLAPQRLAQGLRARGHDVRVYAGWLGEEREPLSSFEQVDETGVPVRWVVTTPFIGWADRANFDNPAVTADFARHLAEVEPDVVHFHSLQSLGAGLVEAARAADARVVVTMHDFWWHCARQFLVTKDFQPCSLVVSCGVCPCEVDHDWLTARNAHLAARLEAADVVLAVSRSAADVFVANGVDPAKVRVDENGLPEADAVAVVPPLPPLGGTVRFAYTGGPHRMKGVHVLLEAARRLQGVGGWRLTVYGAAEFVRDEGVDVSAMDAVEVLPAFAPAQLDDVFARTDVLVVPSVMRESHSLVTREALARGVPVVVTDTLGPEEVVAHETNGLVVPAADVDALADAMRRLATDRDLLERVRTGAAAGVDLRPLSDQLDGLERLYGELVGGAVARPEPARRVRRVLFVVGIQGAPLRYRARLPAEALALLGVESDVRYYRDPDLPALAAAADAVVVYRVPATVQVLALLDAVRAAGTPLFFDVDDLIFDPDLRDEIPALQILPADEAALWLEGVRRYRTTMEACDAFIASTEALRRHAEDVVGLPAFRFFNGVGQLLAQASDVARARPRAGGPLRVGYLSGTNTHDHDWAYVEPAVRRVLDERPDTELWLGGLVEPSPALHAYGERIRRLPFLPWHELPEVLRDLDVNLAPLAPGSRFNEAKSAIKWLEAALVETPTIASPTGPFCESIRHGENGLLAATVDDWSACALRLLDDTALRRRLGSRARRDALLNWSPHLQGRRYLDILQAELPARRDSSWTQPVALDEPPEPCPLEPYAAVPVTHVPPAPPAGRRARARAVLDEGLRSLREQGVAVTAVRAVRFGRRQWPKVERRLRAAAGVARSRVR